MRGVIALILGNVDFNNAAIDLHDGLYALQHRGQASRRISTKPLSKC